MVENKFYFNLAKSDIIDAYAKRMNDEYESGEIGYYHLPDIGILKLNEIYEYEKSLDDIKDIVLVGIGGSSLGVKAIHSMLTKQKRELHFLDNVDPKTYDKVIKSINFKNTLFIISSKSGNTIETITLFKCIIDEFKPADMSKNFLIITDPNTNLQKYAEQNGIKFFNLPSNVGGRFSVLSAIGLMPLGLCGYDIDALLKGALECKRQYIDQKDSSLIAKAYHYATHRHAHINVVFSYSDNFFEFNDWYVQLWAESLGKKKGYKRVGLTPVGLVGSRDQHSFLQLIMDGVKDKSVTFIKIKEPGIDVKIPDMSINGLSECDFVRGLSLSKLINLQCDATKMALVQEGISVDTITLDKIDEWHVGWLIFYYELLTSATGIMLGINTYDQPGVEIGKRILKTMLLK
ncbi:glucose-6-phosphate isomerase [Campylobacter mucosalis]|uniref:Glucose-6-phosphate isomerase n=1 Tax=Campylobacter mucosalis CCUG 21559 TaxID=1032067 RepID=A0A6G5QG30_9BACT|nr:glucose-6-phosphate isomerase [Campylobacter mucosalis]QCD44574.1 phosphoglucose isomerase [Campylobacter mucosalis CCUG 21559]